MKNTNINVNDFVIIRLAITIGVLVFFINDIFMEILLSSKHQLVFIILPIIPIAIDIFTFMSDKNKHFSKSTKKKIIQYWLYLILIGAFFTILYIKYIKFVYCIAYGKIIKDRFQFLLLEALSITILLTFREVRLYKISKIALPKGVVLLITIYILIFQLPAYILSFHLTLDHKLFDALFFLSLITACVPPILNFRLLLVPPKIKPT